MLWHVLLLQLPVVMLQACKGVMGWLAIGRKAWMASHGGLHAESAERGADAASQQAAAAAPIVTLLVCEARMRGMQQCWLIHQQRTRAGWDWTCSVLPMPA